MSIRSRLFSLPIPRLLRKVFLMRLFRLTAGAFGAPAPRVRGTPAQILDSYSAFTKEQAERVMQDSSRVAEVQRGLFAHASSLGARLRSSLGVSSTGEAMEVARALYRLIDVDFSGTAAPGSCDAGCASGTSACFTVSRCSFSACYPPAVCRLISSLDAGLLAGLTRGGKMIFTQRITEGASACKGVVQ